MFDFKNRTAFVTGGASGIGYAIACSLAKRGCKVALADIDAEQLEKVMQDFPGEAMAVKLDVRDRQNWAEAKKEVEAKFGCVDILINNAGIMDNPMKPMPERGLLDYQPEQWDRMIGISLTGMANGIMTFGPGLRERRFGHIVNTSSTQGLIPTAGVAAYSAAKFGVVAMTEAVRDELAPFDVGVSVLCPGVTASRLAINAAKAIGMKIDDNLKMPGLAPAVVGEMVVKGIQNNSLYIFTHGEYRKYCEDRFTRIMAAFTETPVSPDFVPGKPLAGTREWANDPNAWGKA